MSLNDSLLDDMVYAIAGADYYPSKVLAFNDDLDLALAELIG